MAAVIWCPPAAGRFTSPFGKRVAPTKGASTMHRGVDIAPPVRGQDDAVPVTSVGPGSVRAVGTNVVRGHWVVVAHDDGTFTTYQHLASIAVGVWQRVSAGTRVGVMGESGTASGIHLHFECHRSWAQVGTGWSSSAALDPETFMRARGVNLRTAVAEVDNPVATVPTVPTVPTFPIPDPLDPITEDDMKDQAIAVYLNRVGRMPSPAELSWWLRAIATGEQTLKSLDAALAASGESAAFAGLGSEVARNEARNVNGSAWVG